MNKFNVIVLDFEENKNMKKYCQPLQPSTKYKNFLVFFFNIYKNVVQTLLKGTIPSQPKLSDNQHKIKTVTIMNCDC